MHYLYSIIFSMILSTCMPSKNNEKSMNEQIRFEGKWEVAEMVNLDNLSTSPTLVIASDSNKISGNAGCNNYNASFTLEGDTVQVGPIMTTKMFCSYMKIEDAFLECLKNTSHYKIIKGKLTFFSKENQQLLVCKRLDD